MSRCEDCGIDIPARLRLCTACAEEQQDRHEMAQHQRERMPRHLPYAQQEVRRGRLYSVCPVCDMRCPEPTDRTGERKANTYAAHFLAAHLKIVALPYSEAIDLVMESLPDARHLAARRQLLRSEDVWLDDGRCVRMAPERTRLVIPRYTERDDEDDERRHEGYLAGSFGAEHS